jgi:hypothetical protein
MHGVILIAGVYFVYHVVKAKKDKERNSKKYLLPEAEDKITVTDFLERRK